MLTTLTPPSVCGSLIINKNKPQDIYFHIPTRIKKKQQQLTPSDKGLQPCDRMKFCAKKSKSLWASYQIRKIAGCACAGNAGNVFPRRRFQRKPIVSDPGMHHGTCVTHVPWCMSGSLTCGDGENVPGIPGACAPAILRIWQEAHGVILKTSEDSEMLVGYDKTTGKFNWYCISPNKKNVVVTYLWSPFTIEINFNPRDK